MCPRQREDYLIPKEKRNHGQCTQEELCMWTMPQRCGVSIKQYHRDNGTFKSQMWKDHCMERNQLPTIMSGVGAHHQNAVAEQAIGAVTCAA
eukprot:1044229-Ditylum_brightwellii.AAC.2